MRLTPGARLGPYEVLSVLGTGGMAEVYRARDTRLGRDIALKVVNESLASSPELVRRFEQEARLAGSLNHPNVVAVYDVGLHEGAPYFVTELLQGESLRHRLSRGRIPLHTALDWGAQMAQGLAAAHAHGVIHRDVKPDNVFISSDGHVKLLDFGIAKLAEVARDGGPHGLMDVTVTPTGRATRTGWVLGTPGYMSPEQVGGESLDARTDIFSLGAVVYEMLSGKRAFPGATVVESGYAILHNEPEALPAEVPPVVAQVVLHCLEKEPARRLQSASDLAFALQVLRAPTGLAEQRPVAPRPARRRARRIVGGLAVVAALAAAFAAGHRRDSTVPATAPTEIEPVTFGWGTIFSARFLPDARVVFSAAFEGHPEELFVRPPGSPTSQALGLRDVRLLAASRTGELAVLMQTKFSVWQTPQGTLARVPSVGGTPRELAENVFYADWSPDGNLAVVRQSGASFTLEFPPGHTLFRTNGWISHPRFSAKGDRIAFLHHDVADDDGGEVMVTDLKGQTRTLSQRWTNTRGLSWSPDDSEVWFTAGTIGKRILAAVNLGGRARQIYRSPTDIYLEDVGSDGQVLITNALARHELVYSGDGSGPQTLLSWTDWNDPLASLTADGKVLFGAASTVSTAEGLQGTLLTVLRRTDGAPAQILGEGTPLDLSRDGRWALVLSADGTQLTALPTGVGQSRPIPTHGLQIRIRSARWMPDGKGVLVIARSTSDDRFRLYRLAENASGPVRVSDAALGPLGFLQISPDGRSVAVLDEELTLTARRSDAACAVYRHGSDDSPRLVAGGSSLGHPGRTLRCRPHATAPARSPQWEVSRGTEHRTGRSGRSSRHHGRGSIS